jgi:hypothetical protein
MQTWFKALLFSSKMTSWQKAPDPGGREGDNNGLSACPSDIALFSIPTKMIHKKQGRVAPKANTAGPACDRCGMRIPAAGGARWTGRLRDMAP